MVRPGDHARNCIVLQGMNSETPPAGWTPRSISVRVAEDCKLTGIGRSKLYDLIAAGEIEIIKLGASTLIPMDRLNPKAS